jgi:hypothetical protein
MISEGSFQWDFISEELKTAALRPEQKTLGKIMLGKIIFKIILPAMILP